MYQNIFYILTLLKWSTLGTITFFNKSLKKYLFFNAHLVEVQEQNHNILRLCVIS